MALQDFYFIAEIIAAFAVVGSLIFVGVQLQQGNTATRAATSQAALVSWTNVGLTLANSPDLVGAMKQKHRTGLAGWAAPDDVDIRLIYYMDAGLKIVEGNYLHWLDGNLSDDLWHGFHHALIDMFATNDGWADLWSASAHTHSVPFQKLIAEVRETAEIRFNELMATEPANAV
jgi:hypothetical protein